MYEIYLSEIKHKKIPADTVIKLEILPEKLTCSSGKENKVYNVLALGEVIKPGKRKLKKWEISSVFEESKERRLGEYRELFSCIAESEQPFYMNIIRTNLDGTKSYSDVVQVVLEDYEFEERAGEMDSLYYKLKLREYVSFTTDINRTNNGEVFVRLIPGVMQKSI